MSVAFFGTHIDNLQIIAPSGDVFTFVPDAVSLNRPLSCAFPFHDAAADVGRKDDDKLLPTPEPACSPPVIVEGCDHVSIATR